MDSKIFTKALDLIFPWKCMFCGIILVNKTSGEPVCGHCLDALNENYKVYCKRCGCIFEGEGCGCPKQISFDRGLTAAKYDERTKACIHALKYKNRRIYGAVLGRLVSERFIERTDMNGHGDLVVPVPIHKKRLRERGYNQAGLIAASFSVYAKIPVREDILVRVKNTIPQKDLDFGQRRNNVAGAFEVCGGERLEGKTVILADDIYTSGSTLNECAMTLKKHGAKSVFVCTFAMAGK